MDHLLVTLLREAREYFDPLPPKYYPAKFTSVLGDGKRGRKVSVGL